MFAYQQLPNSNTIQQDICLSIMLLVNRLTYVIQFVNYIQEMSTDPSEDPIPYRKDLRKKMGIEDQDSSTDEQDDSSTDKD